MPWARSLARDNAGSKSAARMAMIATNTSSSIRVKPGGVLPGGFRGIRPPDLDCMLPRDMIHYLRCPRSSVKAYVAPTPTLPAAFFSANNTGSMSSSRRQYPFHLIEPKWQQTWEEQQAFRAFNPGEEVPVNHPFGVRHGLSGKVAATQLPPKFYILDMFPYPSGAGLHVGHPEGYTATDILARYKRAQGFNVLHPMGWDAFGLPAEQYAVKTGQHPRKTTEENIATFKRQINSLGFSYDWSREVDTTDPKYFKWTQWIVLKLYNSSVNPKTNKS